MRLASWHLGPSRGARSLGRRGIWVLVLLATRAALAAPVPPEACTLLSRPDPRAPVAALAPFAPAFAAYAKGDVRAAARAFRTAHAALVRDAEALFRPKGSPDYPRIRRFLATYVEPPEAPLRVEGERFSLHPEIISLGLVLWCQTGAQEEALALARREAADTPSSRLALDLAWLELRAGRPERAAPLARTRTDEPVEGLRATVVLAHALAAAGERAEAERLLGLARARAATARDEALVHLPF